MPYSLALDWFFNSYQTRDPPFYIGNITKSLLFLGGTDGDSMMQTEGPVTLLEGKPLSLNCTYQTSYSATVFWYVQYRNKELELLLKSSSGNQGTGHTGFQASLVKSESSFHLQKPSVQTSDSAVYYCALEDTELRAAGGAEHKPQGCCWRSWTGAALGRVLFSLSPVFYAGSLLKVPQSPGTFNSQITLKRNQGRGWYKVEFELCSPDKARSSARSHSPRWHVIPGKRH